MNRPKIKRVNSYQHSFLIINGVRHWSTPPPYDYWTNPYDYWTNSLTEKASSTKYDEEQAQG